MTAVGDFGTIALKWDPKNLEIRTMSVEKTLEPLVLQVTTLVNTKGPSKKKKGTSLISIMILVLIFEMRLDERFISELHYSLVVYDSELCID